MFWCPCNCRKNQDKTSYNVTLGISHMTWHITSYGMENWERSTRINMIQGVAYTATSRTVHKHGVQPYYGRLQVGAGIGTNKVLTGLIGDHPGRDQWGCWNNFLPAHLQSPGVAHLLHCFRHYHPLFQSPIKSVISSASGRTGRLRPSSAESRTGSPSRPPG